MGICSVTPEELKKTLGTPEKLVEVHFNENTRTVVVYVPNNPDADFKVVLYQVDSPQAVVLDSGPGKLNLW